MKLDDPPELVALCREDEDGEEQVAGWAMVLADQVVGYVPDRTGFGASTYTFESLDSAELFLGCTDIYPRRGQRSHANGEGDATVPRTIDWTHQQRS